MSQTSHAWDLFIFHGGPDDEGGQGVLVEHVTSMAEHLDTCWLNRPTANMADCHS